MLGSLDSVGYDIPWPDSMLWMLNIADLVNISLFALPGVNCLYPNVDFFYVVRSLLGYWGFRAFNKWALSP